MLCSFYVEWNMIRNFYQKSESKSKGEGFCTFLFPLNKQVLQDINHNIILVHVSENYKLKSQHVCDSYEALVQVICMCFQEHFIKCIT